MFASNLNSCLTEPFEKKKKEAVPPYNAAPEKTIQPATLQLRCSECAAAFAKKKEEEEKMGCVLEHFFSFFLFLRNKNSNN